MKTPVSTIVDTLKTDEKLNSEVIEGKNLKSSDLYQRFFSAVRGNKEHVKLSEDDMVNLISQGASGNITVMGITTFDLVVDDNISMPCRDLVQKIMEPNGIKIVF